jgi:hypothetical protein
MARIKTFIICILSNLNSYIIFKNMTSSRLWIKSTFTVTSNMTLPRQLLSPASKNKYTRGTKKAENHIRKDPILFIMSGHIGGKIFI